MKDRFTIWIKNIIDGGRIDPPNESWSKISQKLDIENSWQNIDKKLDIETVWNRLDHQLRTDTRMKTYEKISYVPIIALLLLLSLFGVKNEIYDESENQKPIIAQQVVSDENDDLNKEKEFQQKDKDTEPRSKNTIQEKKSETERLTKKPEQKTNNINKYEKPSSSNTKLRTSKEKKIELSKDDNSETDTQYLPATDNNLALNITPMNHLIPIPGGLIINFDSVNRKAPDFIEFGKDSLTDEKDKLTWYYGIGLSANRTWLNDNRLKRASEGSSLYNAIASNNLSFKINAGLNLNQNWAIQSDITLLGSIGQTYGEYINGKYKEGNINVNYNGLQIGIKRNLPSLFGATNLLNKQIVAGGYANHIYEVTQNENIFISNENNQLMISGLYKNWDLGIWGGIEMFYRLNDTYLLGTTVHYKYGLNNIYKGNNEIPAYLRKTNTSELSLSVILRRNSK